MTEESLKRRKQILLDLVNEKDYVPMKAKELAVLLQVSKEERPDLDYVLKELVESGQLSISKRGKYSKPEALGLVGVFSATAKGFGFVSVEGQEEDIYIKESNTNGALDKDTVQVFLFSEQTGKRREGEIVKILSHHITEVVGLYQKCKNYGFVIPDSTKFARDIYVQENRSKGAVDGHKVVVKITD